MNGQFGRYTNFVNLLGCAAIAVPAGFAPGGHLPGGVTLIGPGFSDDALAPLTDQLHRALGEGMGADRAAPLPASPLHASPLHASRLPAARLPNATLPAATLPDATLPDARLPAATLPDARLPAGRPASIPDGMLAIVVVGAHLTGMPLNGQLTGLGGRLRRVGRTTGDYRLFVLPGTVPAKPGLMKAPGLGGAEIAVEVWALPAAGFGAFVAAIPSPLDVGKVALADGTEAGGLLCEAHAVQDAPEITALGGWRAYVAGQSKVSI